MKNVFYLKNFGVSDFVFQYSTSSGITHILPPIQFIQMPCLDSTAVLQLNAHQQPVESFVVCCLRYWPTWRQKKQLFGKKSFLNRANLLWRSKHQKKTKIRRSRMNAKMDTALCSSSFSAWLNPYSAESNVFSQYFPKKFG